MIPTLLWRCPVCQTNDALDHKTRWFKPDLVNCSHCGTMWQVRRVVGDDYYLRVIADGDQVGLELSLREWYSQLKADFELVPISDPSVALEPGEVLYLKGEQVQLTAEAEDPRFFGRAEASMGQRRTSPTTQYRKRVGVGELLLTNERLIWRQGTKSHDFWLREVDSAFAGLAIAFVILYRLRPYGFRFQSDSVLKWLTYVARVAERIKEAYDHEIALSPY